MVGESQNSNGEKIANLVKNLNWPTVALIALTGGGNWFATLQNRGQIDYGREQVIRQVNDLHNSVEDFEKRQKSVLENQNAMMRNDTDVLNQIHGIVIRLDRLKTLDEQRGAPQ